MHLDSFQRIVVDPASISIIRYTVNRPYVLTVNSSMIDLGAVFAPRKEARRRRRQPPDDAPVGGGLGAADAAS
jgi:2,3-bisphosphoglycerate-dependent phosphoglycerate mutase